MSLVGSLRCLATRLSAAAAAAAAATSASVVLGTNGYIPHPSVDSQRRRVYGYVVLAIERLTCWSPFGHRSPAVSTALALSPSTVTPLVYSRACNIGSGTPRDSYSHCNRFPPAVCATKKLTRCKRNFSQSVIKFRGGILFQISYCVLRSLDRPPTHIPTKTYPKPAASVVKTVQEIRALPSLYATSFLCSHALKYCA